MTYLEAQDLSVTGVAVLGNEAMQDVVWEKSSPNPFGFVNDGYRPLDPEKFKDRTEWRPLHPPRGYYKQGIE